MNLEQRDQARTGGARGGGGRDEARKECGDAGEV